LEHCRGPPSWILTKVKNYLKKSGNEIILAKKNTLFYYFQQFVLSSPKNSKKKQAFLFKNGLTTCYLWRHIL